MAAMKGMHIVIVPAWWPTPEVPISGIFNTDYARAFASAGAKVGVIFPDLVSMRFLGKGTSIPLRPQLCQEAWQQIPVIRIRGLHTALRIPAIQMYRYRRWLRRGLAFYTAQYGRPDLLHAMCALPAGWACTHLDDPLADRVIVTERTGFFSKVITRQTGRSYALDGLRRAAAVVTLSAQGCGELEAAGFAGPMDIHGNAVAEEFLTPPLNTPPRNRRPLRALSIGRLTTAKGIGELIEAAMMLSHDYDIEWHFMGDGYMARDIQRRFDIANVANRCHLHGTCRRTTVVRRMSQSDFLVHPTHGETFGNVVAEALCMGLPVVTTRNTACADFITPENGLLVDMGDAESLAAGLRQLIHRLTTYDPSTIARQARARFSPQKLAEWYAELFHRVLSGK